MKLLAAASTAAQIKRQSGDGISKAQRNEQMVLHERQQHVENLRLDAERLKHNRNIPRKELPLSPEPSGFTIAPHLQGRLKPAFPYEENICLYCKADTCAEGFSSR